MTSSQLLVLLHFNQIIDDSLHLADVSPANICVHPNCYMYDNQKTADFEMVVNCTPLFSYSN